MLYFYESILISYLPIWLPLGEGRDGLGIIIIIIIIIISGKKELIDH